MSLYAGWRGPQAATLKPRASATQLIQSFIHILPVGTTPTAVGHLSVSAATPGKTSPARNSSDAPPPVETWVMRSATPASVIAATESPPPTIVVASAVATA